MCGSKMMKRLFLLLIPILFIFCETPIDNTNYDVVKFTVTVPPKTDSYLWGIGDSVQVQIKISFLYLVDSIRILFGEADTVLGNDTLLPVTSVNQKDTIFNFWHRYSIGGKKIINVYVYCNSKQSNLKDSAVVDLGVKPTIDTMINSGEVITGDNYYVYVSATGSPELIFGWYKNGNVLPQDTCDTLKFSPLKMSDSGSYYCIVKNNWGSSTSPYTNLSIAPHFSVSYNVNTGIGGSVPNDSVLYKAGDMAVVLGNTGNLTKTGYVFSDWNTAFDGSGTAYIENASFAMPAANVVLYAQWTIAQNYAVTYNGNGNTAGSVPIDANNYEAGATITTKENSGLLAKTGFTFAGWNTKADGTGTSYPAGSNFAIASINVTFYAKWTTNPTYTITYNGNENTAGSVPIDANNYEAGATITTKENSGLLAKTGFTFAGWNIKADGTGTSYPAGSDFAIASTNVTIYAKWTTNPTYTVKYDGNGNTSGSVPIDANNYEAGATITTKENSGLLAKTGFTFAGWNTKADGTGTSYPAGSDFTIASTNVTIYAKWTTNPTYTVKYDGNGNTSGSVPIDVNNYEAGATVTVKNNAGVLTKTGYIFSGWNIKADGTDTLYVAGSDFLIGSANIIFYASWVETSYSITYNLNGGINDTDNPSFYTVESAITFQPATKTGFVFGGWYSDVTLSQSVIGITSGNTGDIVLYAKWNWSYAITFDGQSATTNPNPETKAVASPATTVDALPTPPAKTGYVFGGWYTAINGGGTAFTASTVVNASKTVYVKWNSYSFTITFDGQSATTNPYPGTKVVASPATTVDAMPTIPAKTGYIFGGWYTTINGGGIAFTATTIVTVNKTVYAKWITAYTLTYSANGENSGTTPVTVNYAADALVAVSGNTGNLKKNGCTFAGWNTERNGCGTDYSEGSTFTMGADNKTLYAKWTISDIDGNIYTTITIGNQVWTVQNLKTTRLKDDLQKVLYRPDSSDWAILYSPGYCWHDNSESGNKNKYGALYNYYAATDKDLAPDGWHVPSKADVIVLENYLIANGYNWDGTITTNSNKIGKSLAAKTGWSKSDTLGQVGNDTLSNNNSGFSALSGGSRSYYNSNFFSVGNFGVWWTTTGDEIYPGEESVSYSLNFISEKLNRSSRYHRNGFSIRLVRD